MARKLIDGKAEWVAETDLLGADGDKDARYQIRCIDVDNYRRIVDSNTTKVLNRQLHRKEDHTDQKGVSDDALEYCLVAWEGIMDGDDPAPCVFEQKKKLPGPVITAIVEYATMGNGGRTADERRASFRATD